MTEMLIMALLGAADDDWGPAYERPDPRGFMEVTVVVPTETPLTLTLSDMNGKVIRALDM